MAALVAIRSTPEVFATWRGDDLEAEFLEDLSSDEFTLLAIEDGSGAVRGAIQWAAETDPDYRHAGIDIYLDPAVHGRGFCSDAIRTLVRYLFDVEGHHRITIDPAADNAAAIRCYRSVGFQPIGVMHEYERRADGTWHDSLFMELLARDWS